MMLEYLQELLKEIKKVENDIITVTNIKHPKQKSISIRNSY